MKRSNSIKKFLLLVVYLIFLSNFLAIGYSSVVGIPNGLVVTHDLSSSVMPTHRSRLTFTQPSTDIMRVRWWLGSPINDLGSWDADTSSRVVSNSQNFGLYNGSYDCFWIHTDISLNDSLILCSIWKWVHTGDGDTIYNVTGEAMHDDVGEVWVLEDAAGREVWYEKSRGFLVNGTFRYGGDYHTYDFVSAGVPGIPGYDYFLLFSVIAIVSIIMVKKRKIKK